jgi:RNA recognition motif. (a.k.a. RRM, RBD, or RNP domain)
MPSYPFINAPLPPTPPPGFPAFDPTNPMAAFAFMQTMFPQMVGMLPPTPNGERRTSREKPRCLDYDTRGYCTLGSSCPYEHGNDLIIAVKEDEYDPTRANFSMNGTNVGSPDHDGPAQRRRKGYGSLGHSDPKRNNRAAFSDPRRPPHKNFTGIVVEQIPEENFEEETVRNFFSQFGKVLEITMKPYKHLAIVNYETHGAAKRAWESPKAIFDNRFVKVYWYRPDLESANVASDALPKAANEATDGGTIGKEGFKEQQKKKQKAYEERMRIKKATEDARQDLVRRRETMAKERGALVKKLAIAEGHEMDLYDTNGMKDSDGPNANAPDPKIKALRDQLAKMQAEAKSLGIDPDAPNDEEPARGGLAARAAYRGFGSSRGRYPGHGFVRGRDPSVRKLDNRPKNIAMSGVEFDSEKEEHLRSHLTLIGPFEDIELNPQRNDSRIVVFKERWMAEQVMHGRTDIPGIGQLELSWVANAGNGTSVPATSSREDVVLEDAGDDARGFGDDAHQPLNDNLDVAGGDEDDWGNIT